MFVCCECSVLSGRGLCDELITRPEESYRLWRVVVCDLETTKILVNEEEGPTRGLWRKRKKKPMCHMRCEVQLCGICTKLFFLFPVLCLLGLQLCIKLILACYKLNN